MGVELMMAFWEAWISEYDEIGAWAIMTFGTENCGRQALNPPNGALSNSCR